MLPIGTGVSMILLPKVLAATPVFVLPRVAERMMQLGTSGSAKSHAKLLDGLAHFDSFKPECIVRPRSDEEFDTMIRDAEHRIGGSFDLLSENRELNGRSVASEDVLEQVHMTFYGTFAVLDPAHFAVYGGEEPGSRIVLVA